MFTPWFTKSITGWSGVWRGWGESTPSSVRSWCMENGSVALLLSSSFTLNYQLLTMTSKSYSWSILFFSLAYDILWLSAQIVYSVKQNSLCSAHLEGKKQKRRRNHKYWPLALNTAHTSSIVLQRSMSEFQDRLCSKMTLPVIMLLVSVGSSLSLQLLLWFYAQNVSVVRKECAESGSQTPD